MSQMGENLSREWNQDPLAPELWDSLQLIKKNPSSGMHNLSQLAKRGSSLSMLYLGKIYAHGQYNVPKDLDCAELWLRRSAEQGSVEGAYGLAWLLKRRGKHDAALAEYRRLADLSYAPAQYVLGMHYLNKKSPDRNIEKAIYYLELAEKGEHLLAANRLSHILMGFKMGPVSWFRGIAKKVALIVPFFKMAIRTPYSDRLRR